MCMAISVFLASGIAHIEKRPTLKLKVVLESHFIKITLTITDITDDRIVNFIQEGKRYMFFFISIAIRKFSYFKITLYLHPYNTM